MHTRWTVSLWLLALPAACLAAGCEMWKLQDDGRTRTQIKEQHASTHQQLAAKQAELSRLKAGLLEEGWTHNESGDLLPPRGLHRGDQVRETEKHLHELEADIAELQNRLVFDRRVWTYRGFDVAELTRDAAIQVTPRPPHRD